MHKVASAPNVGTAVKVEPPASPVKTSASTTPSSSTESELDEKTRNRLARKYVWHHMCMLDVVIKDSAYFCHCAHVLRITQAMVKARALELTLTQSTTPPSARLKSKQNFPTVTKSILMNLYLNQ